MEHTPATKRMRAYGVRGLCILEDGRSILWMGGDFGSVPVQVTPAFARYLAEINDDFLNVIGHQ